jgi:hypothetical protein
MTRRSTASSTRRATSMQPGVDVAARRLPDAAPLERQTVHDYELDVEPQPADRVERTDYLRQHRHAVRRSCAVHRAARQSRQPGRGARRRRGRSIRRRARHGRACAMPGLSPRHSARRLAQFRYPSP